MHTSKAGTGKCIIPCCIAVRSLDILPGAWKADLVYRKWIDQMDRRISQSVTSLEVKRIWKLR